MDKRGLRTVEPTVDAEQAWVDEVVAHSGPRLEQLRSCTPSYYNHEGKLPADIAQNELYGLGPLPYFNLLAEWRDKGDFAGLQVE
jgi:cyclohexanone monooxygenase